MTQATAEAARRLTTAAAGAPSSVRSEAARMNSLRTDSERRHRSSALHQPKRDYQAEYLQASRGLPLGHALDLTPDRQRDDTGQDAAPSVSRAMPSSRGTPRHYRGWTAADAASYGEIKRAAQFPAHLVDRSLRPHHLTPSRSLPAQPGRYLSSSPVHSSSFHAAVTPASRPEETPHHVAGNLTEWDRQRFRKQTVRDARAPGDGQSGHSLAVSPEQAQSSDDSHALVDATEQKPRSHAQQLASSAGQQSSWGSLRTRSASRSVGGSRSRSGSHSQVGSRLDSLLVPSPAARRSLDFPGLAAPAQQHLQNVAQELQASMTYGYALMGLQHSQSYQGLSTGDPVHLDPVTLTCDLVAAAQRQQLHRSVSSSPVRRRGARTYRWHGSPLAELPRTVRDGSGVGEAAQREGRSTRRAGTTRSTRDPLLAPDELHASVKIDLHALCAAMPSAPPSPCAAREDGTQNVDACGSRATEDEVRRPTVELAPRVREDTKSMGSESGSEDDQPGTPSNGRKAWEPAADVAGDSLQMVRRSRTLSPSKVSADPGVPDAALYGFVPDVVPVRATTALHVQVLNADALKVPVRATDFQVLVRGSPGSLLHRVSPGKKAGTFRIDVTADVSGLYALILLCRRAIVGGTPWRFLAEVSRAAARHTTVRGPNDAAAYAGDASRFTIVARDVNAMTQRRGGEALTVAFNGPAALETTEMVDNNDGTYTVHYCATSSGWYSVEIRLADGFPIKKSPLALHVRPGLLHAARCGLLERDHVRGYAGQPLQVTLQSRDRFGNALDTGGASFVAELHSVSGTIEPSQAVVADHSTGKYTLTWIPEHPGMYTITVWLMKQPSLDARAAHAKQSIEVATSIRELQPCDTAGLQVEVEAGTAHAPASTMSTSTKDVIVSQLGWPLTAPAGEWVSVHLTARDLFANALPRGGADVSLRMSISRAHVKVVPEGDQARSPHQGSSEGGPGSSTQGSGSVVLGSAQREPAFTAIFNAVGKVDSNEDDDVGCSDHDHEKAQAGAAKGSGFLNALKQVSVMTEAQIADAESQLGSRVTDLGDGRYNLAFRSPRTCVLLAHVSIDGEPASGSPYITRVLPLRPEPRACLVRLRDRVEVGVHASIEVQCYDRFGNRVLQGGTDVRVHVVGPNVATAHVQDNHDGTYKALYLPTLTGVYQVHVKLGDHRSPATIVSAGEHMGQSPYSVTAIQSEFLQNKFLVGKPAPVKRADGSFEEPLPLTQRMQACCAQRMTLTRLTRSLTPHTDAAPAELRVSARLLPGTTNAALHLVTRTRHVVRLSEVEAMLDAAMAGDAELEEQWRLRGDKWLARRPLQMRDTDVLKDLAQIHQSWPDLEHIKRHLHAAEALVVKYTAQHRWPPSAMQSLKCRVTYPIPFPFLPCAPQPYPQPGTLRPELMTDQEPASGQMRPDQQFRAPCVRPDSALCEQARLRGEQAVAVQTLQRRLEAEARATGASLAIQNGGDFSVGGSTRPDSAPTVKRHCKVRPTERPGTAQAALHEDRLDTSTKGGPSGSDCASQMVEEVDSCCGRSNLPELSDLGLAHRLCVMQPQVAAHPRRPAEAKHVGTPAEGSAGLTRPVTPHSLHDTQHSTTTCSTRASVGERKDGNCAQLDLQTAADAASEVPRSFRPHSATLARQRSDAQLPPRATSANARIRDLSGQRRPPSLWGRQRSRRPESAMRPIDERLAEVDRASGAEELRNDELPPMPATEASSAASSVTGGHSSPRRTFDAPQAALPVTFDETAPGARADVGSAACADATYPPASSLSTDDEIAPLCRVLLLSGRRVPALPGGSPTAAAVANSSASSSPEQRVLPRSLPVNRASATATFDRDGSQNWLHCHYERTVEDVAPGFGPHWASESADDVRKRIEARAMRPQDPELERLYAVLHSSSVDQGVPVREERAGAASQPLPYRDLAHLWETVPSQSSADSVGNAFVRPCAPDEKPLLLRGDVKDSGMGEYTASFAAQIAGAYIWSFTLFDEDVSPRISQPCLITAGPPCLANCVALGTGTRCAVAGMPATVYVQLADYCFNAISEPPAGTVVAATITVRHLAPGSPIQGVADPAPTIHRVSYEGRGLYCVTYTALRAGRYAGVITVDGGTSPGLAFAPTVHPGPTAPRRTRVYGVGLAAAVAGRTAVFAIQACDAFGNERQWPGDRFEIEVQRVGSAACGEPSASPQAETSVTHSVKHVQGGEYAGTLRITQAATWRVSVAWSSDRLPPQEAYSSIVDVFPATPCLARTLAAGPGLLGTAPGRFGVFYLAFMDRFGNARALRPFPHELAAADAAAVLGEEASDFDDPDAPFAGCIGAWPRSEGASAESSANRMACMSQPARRAALCRDIGKSSVAMHDSKLFLLKVQLGEVTDDGDLTEAAGTMQLAEVTKAGASRNANGSAARRSPHVGRQRDGFHCRSDVPHLPRRDLPCTDEIPINVANSTLYEMAYGAPEWFEAEGCTGASKAHHFTKAFDVQQQHAEACKAARKLRSQCACGDTLYVVTFRAREEGYAYVQVTVNGRHVAGSPFPIWVEQAPPEPSLPANVSSRLQQRRDEMLACHSEADRPSNDPTGTRCGRSGVPLPWRPGTGERPRVPSSHYWSAITGASVARTSTPPGNLPPSSTRPASAALPASKNLVSSQVEGMHAAYHRPASASVVASSGVSSNNHAHLRAARPQPVIDARYPGASVNLEQPCTTAAQAPSASRVDRMFGRALTENVIVPTTEGLSSRPPAAATRHVLSAQQGQPSRALDLHVREHARTRGALLLVHSPSRPDSAAAPHAGPLKPYHAEMGDRLSDSASLLDDEVPELCTSQPGGAVAAHGGSDDSCRGRHGRLMSKTEGRGKDGFGAESGSTPAAAGAVTLTSLTTQRSRFGWWNGSALHSMARAGTVAKSLAERHDDLERAQRHALRRHNAALISTMADLVNTFGDLQPPTRGAGTDLLQEQLELQEGRQHARDRLGERAVEGDRLVAMHEDTRHPLHPFFRSPLGRKGA